MPATPRPPSLADSLKGKLLLAMPHMGDQRFDHAVMVMLEHNDDGAMGVMINKPLHGVTMPDLLTQLDITLHSDKAAQCAVMFGGPVEIGRGFILHSTDYMLPQSVRLDAHLAVTTLLEMLTHIADGTGPKDMLFCLGYAGWTAGQLDDEIKQNAWLHAPLNNDLVFHLADDKKWEAALALAGINPDFLTSDIGHA